MSSNISKLQNWESQERNFVQYKNNSQSNLRLYMLTNYKDKREERKRNNSISNSFRK